MHKEAGALMSSAVVGAGRRAAKSLPLNPKVEDGEFYWINLRGVGSWVPARAFGDDREGYVWWVLASDRPLRSSEVRAWRGPLVQPPALSRREVIAA